MGALDAHFRGDRFGSETDKSHSFILVVIQSEAVFAAGWQSRTNRRAQVEYYGKYVSSLGTRVSLTDRALAQNQTA